MKASASPWVVAAALAAASFFTPDSALAQDILTLSNGQSLDAQVLGVSNGNVRLKIGPVESTRPLSQVRAVTMPAPKEFDSAIERWKEGDAPGTLKWLEPLVKNFQGLPAPWVLRASALLGEVKLAAGDTSGAEAAFQGFQTAYPSASGLAAIGLAQLAVEKKDFAGASAKLESVVAEARKTLLAESGKSAEYGKALYLMGRVLESQGKLPEALDDYMLAVTVFYEDPVVVARARERATALTKEKNVVVP